MLAEPTVVPRLTATRAPISQPSSTLGRLQIWQRNAARSAVKVSPLSDEDKHPLDRLGCPIDLGDLEFFTDENRPTLAVTHPQAGMSQRLDRIVIGMHDANTGLDIQNSSVTADFEIDGSPSGRNIASRFKPTSPGVWELKLAKPIDVLVGGMLSVSVKDRQGNVARVDRSFRIGRRCRKTSRFLASTRTIQYPKTTATLTLETKHSNTATETGRLV